jgi:dihydroxyacetone kinase DhaKLM complex PTS-EIIA-like component DhaM
MTKISIVTISDGNTKALKKTLNSIDNQNYKNFKIIQVGGKDDKPLGGNTIDLRGKIDLWDVAKEKRLVVVDFSVFTKKTNEKAAEVHSKAENNYDNHEHHLPEFSQQSLGKVFKYLKKLF